MSLHRQIQVMFCFFLQTPWSLDRSNYKFFMLGKKNVHTILLTLFFQHLRRSLSIYSLKIIFLLTSLLACWDTIQVWDNFTSTSLCYIEFFHKLLYCVWAKPYSLVGGVADLSTGVRWFDPWLGQYFFQGLMFVIVTGFIPLSLLSFVSIMIMWESS